MSILIDTSAWVEFLRNTPNSTANAVARYVDEGSAATTDVVIMEVLSGSTDSNRLQAWERALDSVIFLEQAPRDDVEAAAALYRACRRGGESPPQLTDCLVAAVAIRNDAAVLHRDRDFEVLARHTGLRVVRS